MLLSGTRLCTKDGRKFGNGIIIGYAVLHDDKGISYQIKTDFGNVFFWPADEIEDVWWVDAEEPDLRRWEAAWNSLRSRSSMTEQGIVDPQDAGLVPAVTATDVIIEANNSLFGSQNYFLSTNGGPPDKYHLARPIEELKARCNKLWRELNGSLAQ